MTNGSRLRVRENSFEIWNFGLRLRSASSPAQMIRVERADRLRHEIIVFHEALDATRGGAVGVAKAAADLRLQVEGQALLRPFRQIM